MVYIIVVRVDIYTHIQSMFPILNCWFTKWECHRYITVSIYITTFKPPLIYKEFNNIMIN